MAPHLTDTQRHTTQQSSSDSRPRTNHHEVHHCRLPTAWPAAQDQVQGPERQLVLEAASAQQDLLRRQGGWASDGFALAEWLLSKLPCGSSRQSLFTTIHIRNVIRKHLTSVNNGLQGARKLWICRQNDEAGGVKALCVC